MCIYNLNMFRDTDFSTSYSNTWGEKSKYSFSHNYGSEKRAAYLKGDYWRYTHVFTSMIMGA